MNTIRSHLALAFFGLATIVSLLNNFLSTGRIVSSTQEYYEDTPYVSSSKLHHMWDKELETMYSTTHQRIRGQISFILNDNDETNTGNNDFQHKGILRTSSEKHGKFAKIRFMRRDAKLMVAGETIHKAGTNYSKYVEDTRLVIDVNQTIMFPPKDKQTVKADGETDDNHLCHILRIVTGRKRLDGVPERGIPPVVLNVTADCNILNESVNGQGNTILALYGLRMTTALAKVDFEFHCKNDGFDDGSNLANSMTSDYKKEKSRKLRWVFPWFASYQSSTDERDAWPYLGEAPTQNQVCPSWNGDGENRDDIIPVEKMAGQIQNDVRKMALQLIGSQTNEPKRIHPLIPLDVKPWVPDITPDDVIVHLPCYSDMNDWETGTRRRRSRVGIMQFNEYTKHINKNVKSIGIIRESSVEAKGDANEDVCHRASALLSEYLHSFFKKQQVSISIYENDPLPLQYARIAMAQQSFSSFSTFGMIPIIGTFGEGYFQSSDSSTGNRNSIIQNIVSSKYKGFENIHLMNGNVLSPEEIAAMSFSDISKWLLKSS